jgi:CspA family cold shock protein
MKLKKRFRDLMGLRSRAERLLSTSQDQENKEKTVITHSSDMKKGKVKWYNEVKGFGFIATESGEDIFVHRSGLYSSYGGLQPEQEVTFDTKQGDKGLFAVNVKSDS